MTRVLSRVLAETVVFGAAVAAWARTTDLEVAVSAILVVLAGQSFVVVRIGAAMTFNPVSHRYLMGWLSKPDGLLDRLRPTEGGPSDGGGLETVLTDIGLRPSAGLDWPDDEATAAGENAETEASPDPWSRIYTSASRLILVTVGQSGQPLTALSRLDDGRVVVSSSSFIPPNRAVLFNQVSAKRPAPLLAAHIDRLEELRTQGLVAVAAGHDLVIDQLRHEWDSWNQLGPFLGPFLAVDARPQPHLLQVRPPPDELWQQAATMKVERLVRHRFHSPVSGRPESSTDLTLDRSETTSPRPEVTVDVPIRETPIRTREAVPVG